MAWAEEQSWFGLEDLVIAEQEKQRELISKGLWETFDGKILHIKNMTTHHIRMCINKIIRENWRKDYLPILSNELKRRVHTTLSM